MAYGARGGEIVGLSTRGTIYNLEIGTRGRPESTTLPGGCGGCYTGPYSKLEPGIIGGYALPLDLRPGPYTSADGRINDPTAPVSINNNPATAHRWDDDRWLFARPTHPSPAEDGGAIDSVIHAEARIKLKSNIYQMIQREIVGDKANVPNRPRLEAGNIVGSVRIGLEAGGVINTGMYSNGQPWDRMDGLGGMHAGVVWSGHMPYRLVNGNWVIDERPETHKYWYAAVSSPTIAVVGPAADLWLTTGPSNDIPFPEDMSAVTVVVDSHVGGEFHMLGVGQAGPLHIGGGLLDYDSYMSVEGVNSRFRSIADGYESVEPSPRGLALLRPTTREVTKAERGAVYVQRRKYTVEHNGTLTNDSDLLEAPIVLNQAGRKWPLGDSANLNANTVIGVLSPASDPVYWGGVVEVGDPWNVSNTGPFVGGYPFTTIAPFGVAAWNPSTLAIAPLYIGSEHFLSSNVPDHQDNPTQPLNSWLGAPVGVAPYSLHDSQCQPPNVSIPLNANLVGMLDWLTNWRYETPACSQHIVPQDPVLKLKFYGMVGFKDFQAGQPTIHRLLPGFDGTSESHWELVSGPLLPNPQNSLFAMRGNNYDIADPVCADQPNTPNPEWHNEADTGYLDNYVILGPNCDTLLGGGIYRVQDTQSQVIEDLYGLRCVDVNSQTPGQLDVHKPHVAPFKYYFRLSAPADIGGQGGTPGPDGMIDNNDFVVFLDMFFAEDPIADIGTSGGIFGFDGLFDNNDFVVFIDLFFGGLTGTITYTCPVAPPPESITAPSSGNAARGVEGAAPSNLNTAPQQADPIAALRQAVQAMPPGPRRTQMEALLQQLEHPPAPARPSPTPSPASDQ